MKRLLWVWGVLLLLAGPLYAEHSLTFASRVGADGWVVSWNGSAWAMSFPTNAIQVDTSSGGLSDPVLGDYVNMTTLTLSNIAPDGSTADVLAGGGPLTLTADAADPPSGTNAGDLVIVGSMHDGGLLNFGTFFVAYQPTANDLDLVSFVPNYSPTTTGFFNDSGTMLINLTFGGPVQGANPDLQALILGELGTTASAHGSISGQINSVPTPGALLLGSLGVSLIGWMRRRQTL